MNQQPKAQVSPFAAANDPQKISDFFVDKQTKKFFDNFEQYREYNRVPMSYMDMPWEQVKRIH